MIKSLTNFFGKSLYNEGDPLNRIFKEYNDIKTFISKEKDKINAIKYLYFAKDRIHKILYHSGEVIIISPESSEDKVRKSLAYNYYLDLLIKSESELINYTYSIDFIKILNNERRTIKDGYKYKLMFLAKIILDLAGLFFHYI